MASKKFNVIDVIAVLYDNTVCEEFAGKHAIVRHMLGRKVGHEFDGTIECGHYLKIMFPDLLGVDFTKIKHGVQGDSSEMIEWRAEQIKKFGATRSVPSIEDWLKKSPGDLYTPPSPKRNSLPALARPNDGKPKPRKARAARKDAV